MKGGIFQATATTVTGILANTTTIATLVGSVWDIMVANPIIPIFIAASLLSLGFRFLRKGKKAAG